MQQRGRHRSGVVRMLLCMALATLAWGCSSTAQRNTATDVPADRLAAERQRLVTVAAAQIGTAYRYGGNTRRGFDCSGLVQYSYRQIGLDVPRTTTAQWRHGRKPAGSQPQPGDLLFFAIGPEKNRHVAIYEGQGNFIHAPSSGKRVSRASLDNPYWRSRLTGSRSFF